MQLKKIEKNENERGSVVLIPLGLCLFIYWEVFKLKIGDYCRFIPSLFLLVYNISIKFL